MTGFRIRELGSRDFSEVWAQMQQFTERRSDTTDDEVWFVEHPPVYTLGLNADPSHVLSAGDVPVVETDRGGQVTYHAPGQQIAYVLFDMRRLGLDIRSLVQALESTVIDTVAQYGVQAYPRRDAPGVYVDNKKLGAVGLRVRRGCTYHGIAVNVNMNLEPFSRINPCGMEGLEVTQLADICNVSSLAEFREDLAASLGDTFAVADT